MSLGQAFLQAFAVLANQSAQSVSYQRDGSPALTVQAHVNEYASGDLVGDLDEKVWQVVVRHDQLGALAPPKKHDRIRFQGVQVSVQRIDQYVLDGSAILYKLIARGVGP